MLPADEFRLYQKWKSNEGVDIIPILRQLWKGRRFIMKVTAVVAVVGLLYSFLIPPQYTSSATLMPEYNTSSSGGGGASQLLQQYGGMLGITGGTYASRSNAIRVELYPNIVQSLPFQLGLLEHEYYYPEHDTTASLQTFLTELSEPSFLGYLSAYTIYLPSTIGQWYSGQTPHSAELSIDKKWTNADIMDLSETQLGLVDYLRKRTFVSLDQESATLSIQASMPSANLSASIAQQIIAQLRKYLKEYRNEKLKMDLEYLQEQYKQAERRMEDIRDSLATFQDHNSNLATASARIKQQRLQSRLDRASNLYNGLVRQLEQKKLRLDEDIPVFQILQPVQVPLESSSPNRMLILIVSILLGFTGGAGYLLIRNWKE